MSEQEIDLSLPTEFCHRMCEILGDDYPRFIQAMKNSPSRGLRANTIKQPKEKFLSAVNFPIRQIPFSENGFYVDTDEKLGSSPLHHAGAFYLQEPSAMLPVSAGEIAPGSRVLDLCASPGGKTFQIATAIGPNGLLISNEIDKERCSVLASNVERLGLDRVIVTNTNATDFGRYLPGFFDVLVVDAPCSGEGMFRKTPESIGEWSSNSPAFCADRQREILSSVLPALRPGGKLIYSTCTYSPEENEETVAWLLTNHPGFSLLPISKEVVENTSPGLSRILVPAGSTRRHYPHTGEGEGQFLAVLQKAEGEVETPVDKKSRKDRKNEGRFPNTQNLENTVLSFLHEVLKEVPSSKPFFRGDDVFLPPVPLDTIPLPEGVFYVPGVPLGKIQKGRIIPHHSFFKCFSKLFKIQLDYSSSASEIAAYLHGDTFSCPDAPDGWGVLLCDGYPLGGIKITGAVAMNHYPKGLRK